MIYYAHKTGSNFQMGKASQRKGSHVICELMALKEGLPCEDKLITPIV